MGGMIRHEEIRGDAVAALDANNPGVVGDSVGEDNEAGDKDNDGDED